MLLLVVGAVVVCAAAVLGGITGFGFALVCTPLLLLAGFPLAEVVVVNLTIGLVTRLVVAVKFRDAVDRRRATALVVGCVPGLLLGAATRTVVDGPVLEMTAGGVAVLVAGYLLLRPPASRPAGAAPRSRLPAGGAGMLGGFLGITTSLNGPPPVILLSRQQAVPRQFVADLAVYFVACNALALLLIGLTGDLAADRVGWLLACWLPGALIGNALGTALGGRVPAALFGRLTLGLVLVTGATTVIRAVTGG
ncbi:sulfite exporter TauE/SafE family protein [Blastococcus xanthinilyticus]|uniref:Probable membrane transporter protein n=1 Tax=Blastococcus xanthinilyticus TaxID=1564164 RepID=A0A5S5CUL8_9ACTN|nr:sulfite exporter TauE/SafE family protein [Blastococcus xanthinilyticus]TYP87477.1 hypothetical protein BD833_10665 [Blastococcus xanthinilyticus]